MPRRANRRLYLQYGGRRPRRARMETIRHGASGQYASAGRSADASHRPCGNRSDGDHPSLSSDRSVTVDANVSIWANSTHHPRALTEDVRFDRRVLVSPAIAVPTAALRPDNMPASSPGGSAALDWSQAGRETHGQEPGQARFDDAKSEEPCECEDMIRRRVRIIHPRSAQKAQEAGDPQDGHDQVGVQRRARSCSSSHAGQDDCRGIGNPFEQSTEDIGAI
jgi:hypothetical protein